MAELAIQFPNQPSIALQPADAAGDTFTLDTRTFAILHNTNGVSVAIARLTKYKATTRKQGWGELDVPDRLVAMTANGLTVVHGAAIPFSADGKALITYNPGDEADIEIAAVRLVDVD